MNWAGLGRELSAGMILGMSAVIYALSYGALLFSGPWASFVAFGVSATLITAIFGALSSWLSPDRSFVGGPDSNTISVMASLLATTSAFTSTQTPDFAVATVFVTAVLSALVFHLLARTGLSTGVRYIPFPVMAGFLAATGWLTCSGGLNMISDTPLSLDGWSRFIQNPYRPELMFGLIVAITLLALAPRVKPAVLIPSVMLVAVVAVHTLFALGLCSTCDLKSWLFPRPPVLSWMPPWEVSWGAELLSSLIQNLPSMLVISLVGALTILLSVASLELSFQREFAMDLVIRTHSVASLASGALGGFMPIISVGRTTLNRQAGGHGLSATVAAMMALAMLLGAGDLLEWIPKASLGGLVLFLGIGMLRQWIWDQRLVVSKIEFAQILLIVILVANYGFLVGFSSGLLLACIVFVVSYSRIRLVDINTNLAELPSSVSRADAEVQCLREHGPTSLIFRLAGYVFFGSANKIESIFQAVDERTNTVVMDFTNVSGIDRSALAVIQRILRRYLEDGRRQLSFHLVLGSDTSGQIQLIASTLPHAGRIKLHESLDRALECAEDELLARHMASEHDPLGFLELDVDRQMLRDHCEQRDIPAGTVLSAEGEDSSEIFFIEIGSLEVVRSTKQGGRLRLSKLRAGAMVGELAFYTGEARSASIIASTDVTVRVLCKDVFDQLRISDPHMARRFDQSVIEKLAHSLARTSALAASLR
jgi:sulfate permease, SulP family